MSLWNTLAFYYLKEKLKFTNSNYKVPLNSLFLFPKHKVHINSICNIISLRLNAFQYYSVIVVKYLKVLE